jgi:saccharopine dehydrogenase-like NADP-dependent oxidoreductase
MQLIVVGGGMQGRVIAQNLLAREEKPEVIILDLREPAERKGARFKQVNVLEQSQLDEAVKNANAIVLAVPSEISHRALANLLKTGKPIVDVSFTPDPPLDLDEAAKKSGSCCVVDCGVAPGLSHILAGRAVAELEGLDSLRILVGGMPQDPPPVFRHAIYFNPNDLLAEYVRPARARKHGINIAPSPLEVDFERYTDAETGELDAFISDGLRSLLTSFPDIPDMSEWTLRWSGHLETMKSLNELGLLNDITTSAAIAKTLVEKYPEAKHPDLLLMLIEAKKKGERRLWRLLDRRTNGMSAMSRTTGYTTAAVAMVLARKQFTEPGVHAPEKLGASKELTTIIVNDLKAHGLSISEINLVSQAT